MPCWTRVLMDIGNEWTDKAMEKLGIKGRNISQLTESQAEAVKLEAKKLKMAATTKKLKIGAMISGMEVGSKKLTIRMEL